MSGLTSEEVKAIRSDIKRLTRKIIKEELILEVQSGHFTDPNRRTIVLKLGGEVIQKQDFDVVQKPEYEG